LLNRFRRLPVIIQLAPQRNTEDKEQVKLLLRKHCSKIQELELINGFAARLSVNALKLIVPEKNIVKIYLDREVRALLDKAVPTVKADLVWGKNYSGKGITIAIIDSGVQQHPDFTQPKNRIITFQDFVKNKSQPYDDNGHGTHCAGIALGNGSASGGQYRGPAYDADLVTIKALDKFGSGKASTVIKSLEWCLLNRERYNIRIISLSLGYKATDSYRDDPVCQAVEKLVLSGIAVFAAAGNDGPVAQTINSPGIHPAVITVGSCDDHNTPDPADDTVSIFSSRGPTVDGLTKPDLLAPGSNIIAAKAANSLLAKTKDNLNTEWYISLSGTSMATTLCAGIAAQILEAYPELTPPELKEKLLSTASKLDNEDANTQGHDVVNAWAALNKDL